MVWQVGGTNGSVAIGYILHIQSKQRLNSIQYRRIYKCIIKDQKDVIIDDPAYTADAERLAKISEDIKAYSNRHNLLKAPDPIKVFFKAGTDRKIRDINEELEEVIADLSNTKDPVILQALNSYPIVATHAHTRPFRQKWLNIITGIILPLGLFFYFRMWRFRLRLMKDLRQIKQSNDTIIARIEERHKGK